MTWRAISISPYCEGYHEWHPQEVLAVRWNVHPGDTPFMELLIQYVGFAKPEWVDLDKNQKLTLPWKEFHADFKACGLLRTSTLPTLNLLLPLRASV